MKRAKKRKYVYQGMYWAYQVGVIDNNGNETLVLVEIEAPLNNSIFTKLALADRAPVTNNNWWRNDSMLSRVVAVNYMALRGYVIVDTDPEFFTSGIIYSPTRFKYKVSRYK